MISAFLAGFLSALALVILAAITACFLLSGDISRQEEADEERRNAGR
jgi:cytochrome c biogenesis protein CcdA